MKCVRTYKPSIEYSYWSESVMCIPYDLCYDYYDWCYDYYDKRVFMFMSDMI